MGFAKNRPAAHQPAAQRPSPDFPLFFVQRLIHAHAQVCIGFGRAKWTMASLNSFTMTILNNHFDPFRSFLSLHVAEWKTLSFCLFVCLQNLKERKSILNDVSYFQITVWDMCTAFMILSLSKYGLKLNFILR